MNTAALYQQTRDLEAKFREAMKDAIKVGDQHTSAVMRDLAIATQTIGDRLDSLNKWKSKNDDWAAVCGITPKLAQTVQEENL